MDLERKNIERRDFPTARKGYETAEVDRHLKAIADAVDALSTATPQATVAGTTAQHVEAIVAAAEASAREIEERAKADAAERVKGAEDVASTLTARANELLEQVAAIAGEVTGLETAVRSMRAEVGSTAVAQPEPAAAVEPEPEPEPEPVPLQAVPDPEPVQAEAKPAPEGARLIALNMALSGTPREETARYLRENFDLDNEDDLLDDVYAKAGS